MFTFISLKWLTFTGYYGNIILTRKQQPRKEIKIMTMYNIKANYKGLELNLGTVATLSNDTETLEDIKEEIKRNHNVSDVILTEIKSRNNYNTKIEECLPF